MMSEAYETLGGRGEEDGQKFEEELLQNAHNDKEKISAMEYVAGSITFKVWLYYQVNVYFMFRFYSWIFREVSSRREA